MLVYVHIPFCVRKCHYCDFTSFAGRAESMAAYVDALLTETRLRPCEERVTSLYLGGGTPSLLPADQLTRLLQGLREQYDIAPDAECTAEANPGTLSPRWLDAAVQGGVNRLSLGVQAAQARFLTLLGRIHSAEQAEQAVRESRAAGINNVSVDLMYALPGQGLADWSETLDFALSLKPQHISAYALTIEENTPFGKLRAEGALPLFDEVTELAMMGETAARLSKAGLSQYEVSNYAKKGYRSRHNMGYWLRKPYIGLGCAAHSCMQDVRFHNTENLDSYLSTLAAGRLPTDDVQPLSRQDIAFETLMLGLRMNEGVELRADCRRVFGTKLLEFADQGFVRLKGERVLLTAKGFPVMNQILVRLMECEGADEMSKTD